MQGGVSWCTGGAAHKPGSFSCDTKAVSAALYWSGQDLRGKASDSSAWRAAAQAAVAAAGKPGRPLSPGCCAGSGAGSGAWLPVLR